MSSWNGIDLTDLTITSERLVLRPLGPSDAPAVFDAMQDRHMHAFLTLPDPYTEQDAHIYVSEIAAVGRREGVGIECGLEEKASGRLVGTAALRLPTHGRTGAEIGYAVYGYGRGHGYAAEASRALTEWAFDQDILRVEIRAAVTNLASCRSALGAGFRYEGIARADAATHAGPVDAAVFARLRDESGERPARFLPPLPSGGLSDGVLTLRVVEPSDAEALLDEQENPEARRWAFFDASTSLEQMARVAQRAQLEWLVGPMGRLAMVDASSGEVAGTIALRVVGPPQNANVGYGVRPAFRGKGFTARALRLLSSWAFTSAGFARLELGAKSDNIASQKAALSGGFEPDGIRQARLRNPDGTFSDEVRFALVRPDLR